MCVCVCVYRYVYLLRARTHVKYWSKTHSSCTSFFIHLDELSDFGRFLGKCGYAIGMQLCHTWFGIWPRCFFPVWDRLDPAPTLPGKVSLRKSVQRTWQTELNNAKHKLIIYIHIYIFLYIYIYIYIYVCVCCVCAVCVLCLWDQALNFPTDLRIYVYFCAKEDKGRVGLAHCKVTFMQFSPSKPWNSVRLHRNIHPISRPDYARFFLKKSGNRFCTSHMVIMSNYLPDTNCDGFTLVVPQIR